MTEGKGFLAFPIMVNEALLRFLLMWQRRNDCLCFYIEMHRQGLRPLGSSGESWLPN
jgi:hypothetical protein